MQGRRDRHDEPVGQPQPLREFVVSPEYGLWIGLGLAAFGVALGAVHLTFHGPLVERLRKGAAVVLVVVGGALGLNNLMYVPEGQWQHIESFAEFEEVARLADSYNKPLVVDFGAEWCTPCKEMDTITFVDEAVEAELNGRFELIKIKVDNVDEAGQEEVKTLYSGMVNGALPGVVVFDSSARLSEHMDQVRAGAPPAPAVKLNKFTGPEAFLAQLKTVQ